MKYVKNIVSVVAVLLVCAWALQYFTLRTTTVPENVSVGSAYDGEPVSLVRVVDGDTIVVKFSTGAEDIVRLIGIDAPESVHDNPERNTEEGLVASDYLKQITAEGQSLWLTKDVSDRDKYNRLLRYVWVEPPAEDDTFSSVCLNAKLVADGYAQAKSFPPDSRYADIFYQLGVSAAESGLGVSALWKDSL